MEKHIFGDMHDSEMDCNTSMPDPVEHHEVEVNYTKFMSDGARVFQHSEQCSVETSCSCNPVAHNLQAEQSHTLQLKASTAVRISETRTFHTQSENYKQELREHQIQQWMLRHRGIQGRTPKGHWLGTYPQSKDVAGVSEKVDGARAEIKQQLGSNHIVQEGLFSHPFEEDHVDSLKKQVELVSSGATMDEPCDTQWRERASLRKRKLDDLGQGIATKLVKDETISCWKLVANVSTDTGFTSLREWLSKPRRTVDSVESLHIFKQILQLVDLAHVQGVVLKNVRPSSFILSSLHRVSFVDSASSSSSSGSSDPSRGTPCAQGSILSDIARTRSQDPSDSCDRGFPAARFINSKALDPPRRTGANLEEGFASSGWESQELVAYRRFSLPQITAFSPDRTHKLETEESEKLSNLGMGPLEGLLNSESEQKGCFPLLPLRLMEDTWYTSPEEVQDGTCSYASDIYSLGVLFFELFCPFSSWEEYSRSMLDLRHRILPPHLLSDCPKAAAFCLWLLHPDPNSRPKSRDILSSEFINDASAALAERQEAMNAEEKEAETRLLLDFLRWLQLRKQSLVNKLEEEISSLTSDIVEVKRRQSLLHKISTPYDEQSSSGKLTHDKHHTEQVSVKSARLMSNFDKFEKAYFAMRSKVQSEVSKCHSTQEMGSASGTESTGMKINKMSVAGSCTHQEKDLLGCFFDSICKYARYSRFEVKATLLHGNLLNTSNMVCSLSFDRDQEYFATAGICKRIRIFDYDAVLNEDVDIHYPVVEMMANSKLSSICWNSYIKSHIGSCDYNGVVQLWDASMAQPLMQYKEHKKRTWSVDFSQADPTKLASGSDDRSVKLWSINQEGSIGTIKTEANVCCVQFAGDSAHLLAFGSADYKIYCYDLRNTRQPWCVLADHRKTVSYVKFIDSNTLISASTDNTLKLWDISRTNFSRGICRTPALTFSGHTNEKNFVGLSVMDGYIACGSETNEVFAYHKSLPMPLGSHKFGCIDRLSGRAAPEETGKFVSSVCWRAKSKTLVAANSVGNIKVLEMV